MTLRAARIFLMIHEHLMKNNVQEGNTLKFTAPSALTSGQGLLVGTQFVVVAEDYESGAQAVGVVCGVFDLPVASAADIAVGDALYWDVADAEFNKTAASNWYVGKAWTAAGVGVTSAHVKINPGGAAAAGA